MTGTILKGTINSKLLANNPLASTTSPDPPAAVAFPNPGPRGDLAPRQCYHMRFRAPET